jgi:hypothetical protein
MSLRTLELLREVGLTDSTGSPVNVLGMEEAVLRGKLDYYYTTRANAAEAEVAAERSPDGTFSAFRNSISCGRETERTTAAALVYHRTYVNDPLLKGAEPNQPAMQDHVRSIGLPAMEKVDREAVATALKQIAELTPLIRNPSAC